MKYLKSLVVLPFLLLIPAVVYAASITVSVPLEDREYPASQQIAVPIHINSSDAFNAYTVTVEIENAEFVNATFNQSWTAIEGPTASGNSVTFTAALLGKDKYEIGDLKALTVVVKTPAEGSFSVKGSGTVALTDADANQISKGFSPVSFSVTSDKVKTTMFNIENSQGLLFKVLRIAIPVIILIIIILIVRQRKLRRGRKPNYLKV